jgi:hypothetical protein
MSKVKILGTGTLRSGGTLVSNILSISKKNHVFSEMIYYSRHMYKRYRSINQNSTLNKYCSDFALRLKYKNNIKIEAKILFNFILKNKFKDFDDIHSLTLIYLLKYLKKNEAKNLIEYSNGEWRFIEKFLKMKETNKSFHVIRDPRAVISSFKKLTFHKGSDYWYPIFNWIDSYNHYEKLKKKFSEKKYLFLKFEDLHNNPKVSVKKILNFVNCKTPKNFNIKLWKKRLAIQNAYLNISAYDKKKKIGFSKKRINMWGLHLKDWEVSTIEYLCSNQMKKLGYEIDSKQDNSHIKKGLNFIKKNKKLKTRLAIYLKKGLGTHLRIDDPSKPENWGSKINFGKKFINDENYKEFVLERAMVSKTYNFQRKNNKI